ncbi:hypothetical protein LTR78_007685 [Recurvomyces mirabilis]|uniref:Uncharacterized protein n=1 Tax=Recurvomyces mirabilis TaxID=574656 RepID=A0AAE0WHA1_9PEZI|nr:hypothetical protein LTR78_007685 [Recurvomyces mirabilis]KAK5151572.1 hypothetical protein LTS14_009059 [Recurvomyces mirabilis]
MPGSGNQGSSGGSNPDTGERRDDPQGTGNQSYDKKPPDKGGPTMPVEIPGKNKPREKPVKRPDDPKPDPPKR